MRKYVGKYILLFALCLAIGVSVCLLIQGMHNSSEGQRQTLMNRASDELSSGDISDIDSRISQMVASNNWEKDYGKENVPTAVRFIEVSL